MIGRWGGGYLAKPACGLPNFHWYLYTSICHILPYLVSGEVHPAPYFTYKDNCNKCKQDLYMTKISRLFIKIIFTFVHSFLREKISCNTAPVGFFFSNIKKLSFLEIFFSLTTHFIIFLSANYGDVPPSPNPSP